MNSINELTKVNVSHKDNLLIPHNFLAEQLVLGAILANNETLNLVGDIIEPKHFYSSEHQLIYSVILRLNEKGLLADPVTLKASFASGAGDIIENQVTPDYLINLVNLAVTSIINVADYAKIIYDLSLKRDLISVSKEVLNSAYDSSEGSSATELIEQAENKLFNLTINSSDNTGFSHIKRSFRFALERTERAIQRKDKVNGIATGFLDLDHLLGGLQQSDLLILAARPSMGKTALALNIAQNAAHYLEKEWDKDGGRGKVPSVGFFSLEMSAEQLALRMLSTESGIKSNNLRNGSLTGEEFAKLQEVTEGLEAIPIFIDDTPALSISALRTRARRLHRKHNLQFLVVDYLQLVRGSSSAADKSRVLEIGEITQGLKAIAKELNIPVLALSQLSRAVEQREDKRPQLSDLRESGSIEQDADIVMFIYREEYYLERKKPMDTGSKDHEEWLRRMENVKNLAEIIVAKQRNGPIGLLTLQYDNNIVKFNNYIEK